MLFSPNAFDCNHAAKIKDAVTVLTYTCYLDIPKKMKIDVSDDEAFIVGLFCNRLCTLAYWNISDADRYFFLFSFFCFVYMHLYCNKSLFF